MKFLSILMSVNGIAPIVSPVIGAGLLLFFSWHSVFILLALVGLIQLVATCVYKETLTENKRASDLREGFSAFLMLLKDRYFLGHCLVQCFVFGAFFAYIAGSAFLFQHIYGVSPQTYSFIFGAVGLGMMVIAALPARLANRMREAAILRMSLWVSLSGASFLLLGFMWGAPIWYTVPFLFVAIPPLSLTAAASISLAMSKCGNHAGAGSALIGFFSMGLGGIVMPLTGVAGENSALPMGILMILGYALGLICFYEMIMPAHSRELRKR